MSGCTLASGTTRVLRVRVVSRGDELCRNRAGQEEGQLLPAEQASPTLVVAARNVAWCRARSGSVLGHCRGDIAPALSSLVRVARRARHHVGIGRCTAAQSTLPLRCACMCRRWPDVLVGEAAADCACPRQCGTFPGIGPEAESNPVTLRINMG